METTASAAETAALVAVDWGTSSFRAALVGRDGGVLAERSAAAGILKVENRAFADRLFAEIGPWLAARPLPVVLSGMIGSRNGWVEVPHVPCPADAAALVAGVVRVEERGVDLIFVPGLATVDAAGVPDVMRGEEVQIFGALGNHGDAEVVLPGTHSKWASVRDGRVTGFRTYMTGELYAAVLDHTIIGQLASGVAHDEAAFARGVRTGFEDRALSHALFSARTLPLTGRLPKEAVASYLSGVLIGAEFAGALDVTEAPVTHVVVGADRLVGLYRRAAGLIGLDLAAGPGDAAVRGIVQLARTMEFLP